MRSLSVVLVAAFAVVGCTALSVDRLLAPSALATHAALSGVAAPLPPSNVAVRLDSLTKGKTAGGYLTFTWTDTNNGTAWTDIHAINDGTQKHVFSAAPGLSTISVRVEDGRWDFFVQATLFTTDTTLESAVVGPLHVDACAHVTSGCK